MDHTAKRILSTSLAVLLAFSMIFAFRAESASAAPVKTIKYKSTLTISTSDRYVSLDMGSRLNKAKSVKVSSSKNSVVKARAVNNSKKSVCLAIKRKGKATLTIKVKRSGKTKTYRCRVKAVKYRCPVKRFRVGSHDLAASFRKSTFASFTNSDAKSTVSIRAAKGWKVSRISVKASRYDPETKKYVTRNTTIKNGTTASLKTKAGWSQYIVVTMYKKKTKLKETLTVAAFPAGDGSFRAGAPYGIDGFWRCENKASDGKTETGFYALRIYKSGRFSLYDTTGNPGISGVMGNDTGISVKCDFDTEDLDPPFCWADSLKSSGDRLNYRFSKDTLRLGHNGVWLTFHPDKE